MNPRAFDSLAQPATPTSEEPFPVAGTTRPGSQTQPNILSPNHDATLLGGQRGVPAGAKPHPAPAAAQGGPIGGATPTHATFAPLRPLEFPCGAQRYESRQEIGRGGCGIVLQAFDHQIQREVVIKRILPKVGQSHDVVRRFLNEARITGRLVHPGIVPVYEIGYSDTDGTPFYAMKRVHGQTLAQTISHYHRLPRGYAKHRELHVLLHTFLQVCQTLAYAHRMGVIHRDLKPSNILVGEFGETVVLDWGLAKQLAVPTHNSDTKSLAPLNVAEELSHVAFSDASEPHPLPVSDTPDANQSLDNDHAMQTQQGSVLGTAAYMSPEQARGETTNLSYASDVFSLGVILYEILVGKSPFQTDSLSTTLERVARAIYPPLRKEKRHLPRPLAAICDVALKLAPSDRYADARGLAEDIESYLAGGTVRAYPEPWWARIDRYAHRHRSVVWSTFVAMFVIAMIATLSTAYIQNAHRAEQQARQQAERETQQKSVALERERLARTQALTQLKAARKAVDAWLIELSGDLQYYPGLNALRQQLLEQARSYYTSLRNQAAINDQGEEARNAIRSGDVCRLQGDISQARTYYLAAQTQLQNPAVTHWLEDKQFQLANVNLGLALCELESGNLGPASDNARKGLELAQQASGNAPHDRDAKNALIRAHQVAARCLAAEQRYVDALNYITLAQKPAELLCLDSGDVSDWRLYCTVLEDLARYQELAERWNDARSTYEQIIFCYSRAPHTSGSRPDWLEAQAHANLRAGNCRVKRLDLAGAVSNFESAEKELQAAWQQMTADSLLQENLAIARANLGSLLIAVGDTQGAEARLRSAIDLLQSVIRGTGADNSRILRMANIYVWLASIIDPLSGEFQQRITDAGTLVDHLAGDEAFADAAHGVQLERWGLLAEAAMDRQDSEAWQAVYEQVLAACNSRLPRTGPASTIDHLWRAQFFAWQSDQRFDAGDAQGAQQARELAERDWLIAVESPDDRTSVSAAVRWIESLCDGSLANASDRQRAIEIAQRLTRKHDQHPWLWHWLACAAWRQGASKTAEEALAMAQKLRPHPVLADQLLSHLLTVERSETPPLAAADEAISNCPLSERRHLRRLLKACEGGHPSPTNLND